MFSVGTAEKCSFRQEGLSTGETNIFKGQRVHFLIEIKVFGSFYNPPPSRHHPYQEYLLRLPLASCAARFSGICNCQMTAWKDDHVDLQYGGAKMPIVQDYHANHLIEAYSWKRCWRCSRFCKDDHDSYFIDACGWEMSKMTMVPSGIFWNSEKPADEQTGEGSAFA